MMHFPKKKSQAHIIETFMAGHKYLIYRHIVSTSPKESYPNPRAGTHHRDIPWNIKISLTTSHTCWLSRTKVLVLTWHGSGDGGKKKEKKKWAGCLIGRLSDRVSVYEWSSEWTVQEFNTPPKSVNSEVTNIFKKNIEGEHYQIGKVTIIPTM